MYYEKEATETMILDFLTHLLACCLHTARSDTPDGIRIMKKGFTEVPSTTYARNFIIKVRESGMPFVQEYKQALLESGLQSAKEWLQN